MEPRAEIMKMVSAKWSVFSNSALSGMSWIAASVGRSMFESLREEYGLDGNRIVQSVSRREGGLFLPHDTNLSRM